MQCNKMSHRFLKLHINELKKRKRGESTIFMTIDTLNVSSILFLQKRLHFIQYSISHVFSLDLFNLTVNLTQGFYTMILVNN